MMVEILIGVGLVVFAVHSYASYKYSQHMNEQEVEHAMYYTAFARLELKDGIVYAYDQNDQFMGQGKTKDQLIAVMKLNNPNKVVHVTKSNLEEVGF